MSELTQEYIKSILDYNSETGIFVWKDRPNMRPICNARFLGKRAGYTGKRGYTMISVDNKIYAAHRLAWLYVRGVWPSYIDHINTSKVDNRISNLRECTLEQNNWNMPLSSKNSSGYKGVTYNKNAKKWVAQISVGNVNRYLGLYGCPTAAWFAYCREAKKLRGEFVRVS